MPQVVGEREDGFGTQLRKLECIRVTVPHENYGRNENVEEKTPHDGSSWGAARFGSRRFPTNPSDDGPPGTHGPVPKI